MRPYEIAGMTVRVESDLLIRVPWSGSCALSPELRALLACAECVVERASPNRLQAALTACPSAERLCEVALAHGMLGHLHSVVSTEVVSADGVLVQRLAQLQRAIALRNLRQTASLLQILARLDTAGVRAMAIKGPVWAQSLYGDIARRSWTDLDLLVGADQVALAREALLSQGFADCGSFNQRMLPPRRGDTGQIAMVQLENALAIDLHWRVAVATGPQALTFEQVLGRAAKLELLGRQVLVPDKTDTLLMTAMEGARDRWSTVARLLDLAVQVKGVKPDGWPKVLESARAAGCERRTLTGTAHVCGVLGLATPSSVAAALSEDGAARALVASLQPSGLSAEVSYGPQGRWGLIRWHFATEDRRVDGLRHLAARFLAPSPEDWATVALPARLEWLFPLLRPGRLALKWLGLAVGGRRQAGGGGGKSGDV